MSADPSDVLPPRILVVDDERQIHASVRLRLGPEYEMVSCFDARQALERIQVDRFDLCLTDIHMPHMDGFTFIERARERDPALGYVILSAFDTDENLRRAIPLQIYEFIGKPLPEREGFERRLPDWVDRTRRQRRDLALSQSSHTIAQELASVQLAHEVELVASATARDALLQTANLLTTIHAHTVTAFTLMSVRAKSDPLVSHLARNFDEARKTADAAVAVAEGFFNSAYANRDSSPAFINAGMQHAIGIARKLVEAEEASKQVDWAGCDDLLAARTLSGIQFLLMMIPAIAFALAVAEPRSTVRINISHLVRLDGALKNTAFKSFLWLNRKNALLSHPAILLTVSTSGPALPRQDIEAWLQGEPMRFASIAARGLVAGLEKSHGAAGISIRGGAIDCRLAVVLPT